MGEQSTSWIVDSAWTGQVEEHRMEVDTADVADINVQPGSQRPSSPSGMPPKTRSRAPTLDALPEEGDNSDEANPVPRTPPDKGSGEQQAGTEVYTTPKSRQITRSVLPKQRDVAQMADPNDGRCLITNRPSVVDLCHVIAASTDPATLAKLEYVWEIGYRKLNLDTRHNKMHLRVDWHRLFDKPECKWVLIPELEVLEKLEKIYLKDKQATSDLTELFTEPTYSYYVLPTPALREPICRFPHAKGQDGLELEQQEHETHFPPFPKLGPLQSHILPHFVIFNTGQKLASLLPAHLMMTRFLTRIVKSADDAISMLVTIQNLYEAWTSANVPKLFRNPGSTSNRSNSRSEAGQDDASQGEARPRREGLRSTTKSQEQGSQASGSGYAGGQQRAIHPFQPSEDEESVTDDTVVDDSTDWIEYIQKWRNEDDSATEKQDDGSGDEQLVAYINENARTPPLPSAWDSWKLDWDDSKSRYPTASDRSHFSSNDWAVFKNDVYLTRPGYP